MISPPSGYSVSGAKGSDQAVHREHQRQERLAGRHVLRRQRARIAPHLALVRPEQVADDVHVHVRRQGPGNVEAIDEGRRLGTEAAIDGENRIEVERHGSADGSQRVDAGAGRDGQHRADAGQVLLAKEFGVHRAAAGDREARPPGLHAQVGIRVRQQHGHTAHLVGRRHPAGQLVGPDDQQPARLGDQQAQQLRERLGPRPRRQHGHHDGKERDGHEFLAGLSVALLLEQQRQERRHRGGHDSARADAADEQPLPPVQPRAQQRQQHIGRTHDDDQHAATAPKPPGQSSFSVPRSKSAASSINSTATRNRVMKPLVRRSSCPSSPRRLEITSPGAGRRRQARVADQALAQAERRHRAASAPRCPMPSRACSRAIRAQQPREHPAGARPDGRPDEQRLGEMPPGRQQVVPLQRHFHGHHRRDGPDGVDQDAFPQQHRVHAAGEVNVLENRHDHGGPGDDHQRAEHGGDRPVQPGQEVRRQRAAAEAHRRPDAEQVANGPRRAAGLRMFRCSPPSNRMIATASSTKAVNASPSARDGRGSTENLRADAERPAPAAG